MVASWRWVLILFTFKHLVESGTIAYIKNVIMVVLMTYGGLTNEEIALNKLCV